MSLEEVQSFASGSPEPYAMKQCLYTLQRH